MRFELELSVIYLNLMILLEKIMSHGELSQQVILIMIKRLPNMVRSLIQGM